MLTRKDDKESSDWSDGSSSLFSLIEAEGFLEDSSILDADTFIAAPVIVEWPPSQQNDPDERPPATKDPSNNHDEMAPEDDKNHGATHIDVVGNEEMEDKICSGGSELSVFDDKSEDTDDQISVDTSSSYYHISRSDTMSIGSSCDSTTFEKISPSSSSSLKIVVQENVHLRQLLLMDDDDEDDDVSDDEVKDNDDLSDDGVRDDDDSVYKDDYTLYAAALARKRKSSPQPAAYFNDDDDDVSDDEVKDEDVSDDGVRDDDDSVYKDDYTLYAAALAQDRKSSLSQATSFNNDEDDDDDDDDTNNVNHHGDDEDDDDDSVYKDDYSLDTAALSRDGKYSPRSVTSSNTRSRSGIVVPRAIDSSGSKLESDNNGLFDTILVKAKKIVDPYGEKGIYSGVLSKSTGMPHGIGRLEYEKEGRWYAGDWIHGRWTGYGRLSNGDGDFYEGELKNDHKHGTGVMKFADGRIFEGEYIRGQMIQGKMTYPEGSVYGGSWVDGMRHGRGKCIFVDGSEYEGEFKEGNFHGHGQMTWNDGGWYVGEWCEGEMHGKGKEIRPDGSLRHDGEWSRGQPIGRQ